MSAFLYYSISLSVTSELHIDVVTEVYIKIVVNVSLLAHLDQRYWLGWCEVVMSG